ncbi:hypothetical protein Z043_118320 [Scleropages formosus]|uniref:BTB domain-containing protein n=1 Tax=Scleropages formosus TaxID=113540 RepID=A0A0P7YB68_SCLFO|nr:hypothetical protein Z043_118320 [Scleropages formosus]
MKGAFAESRVHRAARGLGIPISERELLATCREYARLPLTDPRSPRSGSHATPPTDEQWKTAKPAYAFACARRAAFSSVRSRALGVRPEGASRLGLRIARVTECLSFGGVLRRGPLPVCQAAWPRAPQRDGGFSHPLQQNDFPFTAHSYLQKKKPPDCPMNNRKEDMEITSHYRQLLRELNEQRQHGILCDVCIIVEGKIFKAHKNVLLGSSRYFKTLYCQVKKSTEQQATITHLDIVTAQGFKTILDFMYSAHLALTSKNVIEVMSAASYLQMTDIVQACHNFIKAALDISIRSELADELADFEMGATAVGGAAGAGAEALASMMSGRSSSPWLARRTSPANSSGDSAIASCHESSSTYGKEDQEPKSHESQEDVTSQPLWPAEFRPIQIKEEQVSPSNFKDGPVTGAQTTLAEQANGEAWQPSGSGRRKNRKNKDTVRHITPQAEDDSRACSPLPTVLPVPGWNYNNQEIPAVGSIHFTGRCLVRNEPQQRLLSYLRLGENGKDFDNFKVCFAQGL